jgi:hypothetical protein
LSSRVDREYPTIKALKSWPANRLRSLAQFSDVIRLGTKTNPYEIVTNNGNFQSFPKDLIEVK